MMRIGILTATTLLLGCATASEEPPNASPNEIASEKVRVFGQCVRQSFETFRDQDVPGEPAAEAAFSACAAEEQEARIALNAIGADPAVTEEKFQEAKAQMRTQLIENGAAIGES